MLRIEIDIPRPLMTFFTLVLVTGGIVWWNVEKGPAAASLTDVTVDDAVGGHVPKEVVQTAEKEGRKARAMQAVLGRREEILRYQIRLLEEQRRLLMGSDSALEDEYRKSIALLAELLREQRLAEERIAETLAQIWEAEDHGDVIAPPREGKPIRIGWPIEPEYGISAGFLDEAYEERIGIKHYAIDIPALQESIITAAADGIVEEITDNALGYNWITIKHDGFATLYGHIVEGLTKPGQAVWKGDPIAISGGLPGTPGAGYLSTGPHLHFEVITDEGRVDPLLHLPKVQGLVVGKNE